MIKKLALALLMVLLPTFTLADNYACSFSFTPASSTTDAVVIFGSSTKTVAVFGWGFQGEATLLNNHGMQMIKRSTVDTGGTSAGPVTLVPLDSASPASTAAVSIYSANPTLGTAVGAPYAWNQIFEGLTNIIGLTPNNFGTTSVSGGSAIILHDGECLAVNFGGAKPSGAVFTGYLIWAE